MFSKFRRKDTFWPFKQCTPSVKHFPLFCFFIGKGKIKWCYSCSLPFVSIYSSSWWPLIWSLCGFIGSAIHAAFIQRINWILWIRRVTLLSTMCLEMWRIGSPCFLGNFGFGLFFYFFFSLFFKIPGVCRLAYPCSLSHLCSCVSTDSILNVTRSHCLPDTNETSVLSLKTQTISIRQNSASATPVGSCCFPMEATCKNPVWLINLLSCIEKGLL